MFTRIDHVGIAVKDMDKALKLYSGVFGLPLAYTMEFERWGARDVTLALADGYVQLIESINPQGPVGRFLERWGEGVYEVALEVQDIEETERQLRAAGLEVRPGVQSNVRFIGPKDTHGVVFELADGRSIPQEAKAPERGREKSHLFRRIHHVGVAVRDLDKALDTYSRALGLPFSHTIDFERWGAHDVMLSLGNGYYWELIQATSPDKPVGRFLARHGDGVYVVSLEVEDIQEAERRAKAGGLTVTPGVQPNIRFLHPSQTHGVLIEMHGPAA